MNTKIDKNSISSIIIIIIIICCAGGAITWGVTLIKRSEENRAKVEQLQTELNFTKQKVELLPTLKEKHKAYEEVIQQLKEFIPSKEEQANFVLILEGLARRSDVIVKSCKLTKEPKQYQGFPNYRIFQWEVDIEGNYNNIKSFLELLQKANRLVMVYNLKMNAYSDTDNGKAYSINTNLKLDLITKLDSGR